MEKRATVQDTRDNVREMIADDPECRFLVRRWLNGDSALPLVESLMETGQDVEAGATARLALKDPECPDREPLEAALRRIAGEPEGWSAALEDFARNPSEERWELLMRFVPLDDLYQRLRSAVPLLMRLGCDGNILFRCAARSGMSPDMFELAASGEVDPEVIEERGAGSPARPCWLGLAAQAAFARGDRFGTMRYLREAMSDDDDAYLAWGSISEIRQVADDVFNAELDQLGIPRV